MSREFWSCEACGREFGFRQAHVCVPPLSVEAYFAGRPAYERPIFDAVRDFVTELGPMIVEPVNIGILFKARRTFAELRPKTRWVNLTFGLERRLEHLRITRTVPMKSGGGWYGTRLTGPGDVDELIEAWLAEAYVFGS